MRANSSALILRLVWRSSLATLPSCLRSGPSAVLTVAPNSSPLRKKWQSVVQSRPFKRIETRVFGTESPRPNLGVKLARRFLLNPLCPNAPYCRVLTVPVPMLLVIVPPSLAPTNAPRHLTPATLPLAVLSSIFPSFRPTSPPT